jgi:large subunit ribosomal protein L6
MSRVGKAPIALPDKVEVKVENSRIIVKGPKGELSQELHPDMKVEQEDGTLTVVRPTEQKRHRAMHGLYRALIANMVEGVTNGFKKELELVGVGYKASNRGNVLELSIGYSHDVVFQLPDEISLNTVTEKGKSPLIVLESHDKQLLGQVAAKIRSFREPEPYKGKGIRYKDEYVRRKDGKAASK